MSSLPEFPSTTVLLLRRRLEEIESDLSIKLSEDALQLWEVATLVATIRLGGTHPSVRQVKACRIIRPEVSVLWERFEGFVEPHSNPVERLRGPLLLELIAADEHVFVCDDVAAIELGPESIRLTSEDVRFGWFVEHDQVLVSDRPVRIGGRWHPAHP